MSKTPASALTLVSHPLCPYVQRAIIMLTEKGVAFERRYIDLQHKPDWFLNISPLGKVPLLIVRQADRETVLFESMVICEYLEETQPKPAFYPDDALQRAQHRAWIEFGSAILANLWSFQTAKEAGVFEEQKQFLKEKFARVEAELGKNAHQNAGSGGAAARRASQATAPRYFGGEHFGMVDAIYAPIFFSFNVFDKIAAEIFAETPNVQAWREALMHRPSVRGAPPADYADRLRAYLAQQQAYLLKISA